MSSAVGHRFGSQFVKFDFECVQLLWVAYLTSPQKTHFHDRSTIPSLETQHGLEKRADRLQSAYESSNRILLKLVDRISDNPKFLAYYMRQNETLDELSAQLSLNIEQLGRLALCRPPRTAADIEQIAAAVPVDAAKLAEWWGRQ